MEKFTQNNFFSQFWKQNTIYLFLIFQGQQIAAENPEIQHDMMEAVQAVQATGEEMSSAAKDFAADPCSSVKRGNMVRIFYFIIYLDCGVTRI